MESAHVLLTIPLAGGIILGMLGYLSALWGFATILRIGVCLRIPIPVLATADYSGWSQEAQGDLVGRQSAGLLLLAVGFTLILAACAVEGYVFALLVHLALA